jgi:MFS family permease/GNAT superfamily N-acetyltransferase
MNTEFRLRRATPGQQTIVIHLLETAAEATRADNESSRGTVLWRSPEVQGRIIDALSEGRTWIAWNGELAVATVTINKSGNSELWSEVARKTDAIYLQWFAVNREYANTKLAADLINWAGKQGKRDNPYVQMIRIDASSDDKELGKYYEKLGFKPVDFCDTHDSPTSVALFEKPVQQALDADTSRITEEPRSPWRVLAHRDFRLYFVGNTCSNLGTWFQNSAQIVLAYRLSHGSAFAVGLVISAQFSSALLVGPWAGMLADRLNRRRFLFSAQTVSFATSLGLAALEFMHALTLQWLILGALVIGLSWTFSFPAVSALVPTLVPSAEVKPAMTLDAVSNNVGRALAPVLSMGVVIFAGFGWAFIANAISFAVMGAALLLIEKDTSVEPTDQRPRARDGLRLVLNKEKPMLWRLVAVGGLATFTTDPLTVLGPALATKTFGLSDGWSSCFLTAMGIGTVLGSLIPSAGSRPRHTAWFVALLAVSVLVFSTAPLVEISVAAAVATGAASLLATTTAQTLLLKQITPAEAGRIMAVWVMAFAGSRPIASVIDGWLAVNVGPRWAGALITLPALLATSVFVLSPHRRKSVAEELLRSSRRMWPFHSAPNSSAAIRNHQ